MYSPGPVPREKDALLLYLVSELDKISNVLSEMPVETVRFKVLHSEPAKPRVGMVAYADGTNWNPGGTGEGLYQYTSAGWSKL